MLRIERAHKNLISLGEASLADVLLTERYDLQEFIFNSPEEFFREIGLQLFVIAKEFMPSEVVQDRIDLLAIDPEGRIVIMELKRGNHKLQLLQAISYAAMIAKWAPDKLLQLLDQSRRTKLFEFLVRDTNEINHAQRIVLIAEAYDFEVLAAAEWLYENYAVDILCCRLSLATDHVAKTEYLSCTVVFPPPELARQALRRRGSSPLTSRWQTWEEALKPITNAAVRDFFKREIDGGREAYLPKRTLRFKIAGKTRLFVGARTETAYCWQKGRFVDDVAFWAERIDAPERIAEVASGRALSFPLSSERDFSAFYKAATGELSAAEWDSQIPSDDFEMEPNSIQGMPDSDQS